MTWSSSTTSSPTTTASRYWRPSLRAAPPVPVIIATGAGSEEIAVRAMKLGAADYINKESYGKFFHLLPPH